MGRTVLGSWVFMWKEPEPLIPEHPVILSVCPQNISSCQDQVCHFQGPVQDVTVGSWLNNDREFQDGSHRA